MPEVVGTLIVSAVLPELAAAAAVPLSIGGFSLGVSAASIVGAAAILGAPVGSCAPLTPARKVSP